jgi:hypothetical protein
VTEELGRSQEDGVTLHNGSARSKAKKSKKPSSMAIRISDMAKGFAISEIQTANASFAKSMADRILASNTLADSNLLIMRNSVAASVHRMNKDLVDAWQRMTMPTFDAISSQWSTRILQSLTQFDWRAIERAVRVQEARRPRTRIGFAALNAYDELYYGHPWIADEFLSDFLGIDPTEDRREALWIVLREAFERNVTYPAQWITLDDERATNYLRNAVYKQAKRVKRNMERGDRVWWTETNPETKKKIELPRPAARRDKPRCLEK